MNQSDQTISVRECSGCFQEFGLCLYYSFKTASAMPGGNYVARNPDWWTISTPQTTIITYRYSIYTFQRQIVSRTKLGFHNPMIFECTLQIGRKTRLSKYLNDSCPSLENSLPEIGLIYQSATNHLEHSEVATKWCKKQSANSLLHAIRKTLSSSYCNHGKYQRRVLHSLPSTQALLLPRLRPSR